MPAARKRGNPACSCGCEQPAHGTTRTRKLLCQSCGFNVRVAPSWLTRGIPTCPCGGDLAPVCLLDGAMVPGWYGEQCAADLDAKAGRSMRAAMGGEAAARKRRVRADLEALRETDPDAHAVRVLTDQTIAFVHKRSPHEAADLKARREAARARILARTTTDDIPF